MVFECSGVGPSQAITIIYRILADFNDGCWLDVPEELYVDNHLPRAQAFSSQCLSLAVVL